jgi:hypothetical protein
MSRARRVLVARAAAELASAIRHGDAAAVDRSQHELARLARPAPRVAPRFPHP